MKRIFSLYILLLLVVAINAQVQVSAPGNVPTGDNFRVEYHVSSDDISDVRFSGKIPEGLEEIAGPYMSTQSSYQIINGHTSSSSSARISYVFFAAKPGSYTIPAVNIRVGGKTLTSRAVQVKVSGSGNNMQGGQPQSAPHMRNPQQQQHQQSDNAAVSSAPANSSNVFIRVTANKNTVVEQEPIKLTYKLYTASQITVPSDLKMPNVQDFTIYEIEQPKTAQWTTESVNGKAYKCAVWKQYIVYPQSTGKLTVPGSSVQINRVVHHNNVDPIEQMFNPGSTYHEEEMDIAVPALTVNVVPLPQRPANFSGGVGHFNMSAAISKSQVKAGEPVTVRVSLSGVGNMKLVKQPTVNFPKDFEVYDPKVTDNTQNTNAGVEGSMTYEFIAIPQNKGDFTIPAVEFTYYDTQTSGYKTIKSSVMKLKVDEADASSSSAESYQEELRNSDIYSIKQFQEIEFHNNDSFFLSASYVVIMLLLLVTFFVLLYVFRKRAIERADVVRMKANRANKVASKKLQKAAMLMRLRKKDEFYDEVLRALWGYAADKINIPVESLSKDNIQEQLLEHNCNSYSVEKFTDAISECEYARYAPSQDEKSSMKNIYDMAVTAITEIEDSLKMRTKSGSALTVTLMLFFAMTFASQASRAATTIESANSAYQSGNYQQAITLYEQALKAGDSPELFYNLGNAYYRTNQITKALLNYEKAYIYNPADADVRHNLDYVRTKTVDKQIPAADLFFVSWYKSLTYIFSIYGWAIFSIVMILLSLAAFLVYLFTPNLLLRKISFWATFLSLVLFVLSIVFALQQSYFINNNKGAIVTAKEAVIKKAPEAGSSDVATIHEGTHIDIIDDAMKDWKEIELPDGKTGWVKSDIFMRIVIEKKN